MPARGPEPISARSSAIFVSETATTFSAPESSTSASRLACASKGSSGGGDLLEPGFLLQPRADLLGELRVRVQAGAGGGAAERDLPDVHERGGTRSCAERDLRGVAGELLAERDGDGVHQVRAPGLDDVLKAFGLLRERALELRERRQQLVLGDVERGEVDGRGEDVVGGLAHVDVVVGVRCPRRRAWRSPRWRSCSSRCPSRSGRRRSGTARRACRRRSRRRLWRSARRCAFAAGRARR